MSDSAIHRLSYRPDIDGLRAIAVMLVVGFHAFPEWVPGGFIGVDLFFVISGFLITSIILRQLKEGQFSFGDFYARRVRRIFPALLLLLGCMHLFGWFFMLDEEYREIGRHVAGGSFFVSNFVLFNEVGYFDGPSSSKPLLHLWSLGIEEQFYLLLPVLLWSCAARRQAVSILLFGLALFSFIECLRLTVVDPTAAFYLPQARFWQLLSGSLLAWWHLRAGAGTRASDAPIGRAEAPMEDPNTEGPTAFTRSGVAVLGLLLIVYALANIDEEVVFPGGWALLPVAAGVALIWAGPGAVPNRLLLSRPSMVWIGKISYPLYLWHWPLLSLPTIGYGRSPDPGWRVALMLTSVVLAWMTYRYLEQPVRARRSGYPSAVGLTAGVGALGVFGLVVWFADGLPGRVRVDTSEMKGDVGHREFHDHIARNFFPCEPQAIRHAAPSWEGFVRCNQSRSGIPVRQVLIGDSHAEHYFIGLAEALPERNVAFYIRDSAPFLANPEFGAIFDEVATSAHIDTVIVAALWRTRMKQLPPGSSLQDELNRITRFLGESGKRVLLIEGTPIFSVPPRACKMNRWFQSTLSNCLLDADVAESQRASFIGDLRGVALNDSNVTLLETWRYVCDREFCSMASGDSILFRDTNHLNVLGSRRIGAALVEDYPNAFR